MFSSLLKKLPNYDKVLKEDEVNAFEKEVNNYSVDDKLPEAYQNGAHDRPKQLDAGHSWTEVKGMGRYDTVCGVVLPLTAIFHGPQVEGCFSAMGDVITNKRHIYLH